MRVYILFVLCVSSSASLLFSPNKALKTDGSSAKRDMSSARQHATKERASLNRNLKDFGADALQRKIAPEEKEEKYLFVNGESVAHNAQSTRRRSPLSLF